VPCQLARIQRCRPLFSSAAPPQGWRLIWLRLTQRFRLMVGVQDYQNYLRHRRQRHPLTTPMSEKAFHRYCLEAPIVWKPDFRLKRVTWGNARANLLASFTFPHKVLVSKR
jgi:uncharacterized short protein YbdD (DUF466 family)